MYDDALFVLKKDKKLKKIILSVGECKIKTISNPFEALVEAIITQQISDSAGKSISKRFKNLFGKNTRLLLTLLNCPKKKLSL